MPKENVIVQCDNKSVECGVVGERGYIAIFYENKEIGHIMTTKENIKKIAEEIQSLL